MQSLPRLVTFIAATCLSVAAAAQTTEGIPPDECTEATDIGPGAVSVGFNTVGATTSAPAWPCASGGADIWFRWSPDQTGQWTFSTCGMADYDTALQVFAGDCASLTSIGCNDDGPGCNLQSLLTAGCSAQDPCTGTGGDALLVAGTEYFLRVGGFNGATGSGTLDISFDAPCPGPPAPIATDLMNLDDCVDAALDVVIGGGTFTYDNSCATTGLEGQNEVLCDFASCGTLEGKGECAAVPNDVWLTYVATVDGTVTLTTCNTTSEQTGKFNKIAAYPGPGCPVDGTALACNDGGCGELFGNTEISFSIVRGECYTIQLGSSSFGKQPLGGGGSPPSLVGESTLDIIEMGDLNLGQPYCPNNPNSTGLSAEILAHGTDDATQNDFHLTAVGMPPGEFGYFLSADGNGTVDLVTPGISNGFFCLGGGDPNLVGRFSDMVQMVNACGSFSIDVDLTAVPIAGGAMGPPGPFTTAIVPGDTWYFQGWYRDSSLGNDQNNFTSAVCVSFGD